MGFTTAAALVHELIEARDERRLLNLQRRLARLKLLIIDEGFVPLSNPFHILIAEVLLRQTQAARVVSPYIHLVTTYPDLASLAEADVDALRQWFKPLSLVRCADRLVHCARRLQGDYGGQVPR